MRNLTYIFILVISLCACSHKVNSEGDTKKVEILLQSSSEEPSLLDNIFNVDSLVQLETAPECMITNIKRLLFYKGCYYVLDNYIQQSVIVFDSTGHFQHKIGQCGHGQGEYVSIEDFAIDIEGERLIILSDNSTVFVYALNGNFLFKKTLDTSLLWNIASNSKGFLLTSNHLTYTSGENAYLFYFFDKDFNLKKKFYNVLPEQMHAMSSISSNLYSFNDKFVYTDMYSYQSFIINIFGDIDGCYWFHLSNPMPQKYFRDSNMFMEEQLNYDYILDNMFVDDIFITFFYQNGKANVALIDKYGSVVKNNSFYGIIPKLLFTDGKAIVTAFNVSDIKVMSKYCKFPIHDIEITPECNMVIAHLKPNNRKRE